MKIARQKIIVSIVGLSMLILPNIVLASNYLGNLNITLANGSEIIKVSGSPKAVFRDQLKITNYSPTAVNLNLFTTDAAMDQNRFIPAAENSNENLSSWIDLSADSLTLKAGETRNIPFSIAYPENAGVGQHYAAIWARQNTTDAQGNSLHLESGIRVYATVDGQPVYKYKIINPTVTEKGDLLHYSATIINTGTTDLQGRVELINQTAGREDHPTTKLYLQPGEDDKISLSLPQTSFGPERIVSQFRLADDTKTFLLADNFQLPKETWPLAGLLIFILTVLTMLRRTKLSPDYCRPRHEITIFVLLFVISMSVIGNLDTVSGMILQADSMKNNQVSNYLTTIKWGNLEKKTLPKNLITSWDGYAKLNNGQMYLVEKLHNEKTDEIKLNGTNDILTFQNTTGPDNDGVILLIKTSPENAKPTLTFHNPLTGEEIPVQLENTLTKARYIRYKQSEIEITSEAAPDAIQVKADDHIESVPLEQFGKIISVSPAVTPPVVSEVTPATPAQIVTEVTASPEIGGSTVTEVESTPNPEEQTSETASATTPTEVQTQETVTNTPPAAVTEENTPGISETIAPPVDTTEMKDEISLLKDLIKDIPASPDTVSEYILNSTYIDGVSSQNETATVTSAPALIDTLKDAPLTIQEMTSTPDLNFVFLPNETVKLTPQPFSFTEQNISSQELNEMFFVQRKEVPWTVYFSITNFVSVAGDAAIPADNVSVFPGKINVVNQTGTPADLKAGPDAVLTGINDQANLVTITPQGSGETTFSIKPRISVNVPPKTPPGLYKATITIKVI